MKKSKKRGLERDLIMVFSEVIVFNNIESYQDNINRRTLRDDAYSYLEQATITVYDSITPIQNSEVFSKEFAIKFPVKPNRKYQVVISSLNCYPQYVIQINTDGYNLPKNQKIIVGTSEHYEESEILAETEIPPYLIKFTSKNELEKNRELLDSTYLHQGMTFTFNPEEKKFDVSVNESEKQGFINVITKDIMHLPSYKKIKTKLKETANDIIHKVDFSKKDSMDNNKDSSTLQPNKTNNQQSKNSKSNKLSPYQFFKKSQKDSNATSVYSYLTEMEELELSMEKEPTLEAKSIEEKKKLFEQQQNIINDGWKNAKTKEDTMMLLTAEQRLENMAASLEIAENELKKSNELAKANQKLFEEQKEKTSAIKAKNQYLFFGILLSVLLIVAIIFFLAKSRRLNSQIKLALEQVEETNEELNQSNEELAAQRDQLDLQRRDLQEAHNEIQDSIKYAQRIQNAILPAPMVMKEHLPQNMVLYKPKDVVAGDFYWLESVDDTLLFAAADCTGHGVPGAMVSVVCHNALNRAVREFNHIEPGKILDVSREIVLAEFDRSEDNVQDGMDIALCSLKKVKGKLKLEYAGANNPLWVFRDNELIEIKADRQPIGKFDRVEQFSTHSMIVEKNDVIYIFTDGYQDQFGGDRERRFGTKRLKKLLLEIHNEPLEEQKKVLESTIQEWMKTCQLGQVDDICIIGVRI